MPSNKPAIERRKQASKQARRLEESLSKSEVDVSQMSAPTLSRVMICVKRSVSAAAAPARIVSASPLLAILRR
jgi:hypothetical protein